MGGSEKSRDKRAERNEQRATSREKLLKRREEEQKSRRAES
jgi:hypothetical protein